jgi:hypothetical protein
MKILKKFNESQSTLHQLIGKEFSDFFEKYKDINTFEFTIYLESGSRGRTTGIYCDEEVMIFNGKQWYEFYDKKLDKVHDELEECLNKIERFKSASPEVTHIVSEIEKYKSIIHDKSRKHEIFEFIDNWDNFSEKLMNKIKREFIKEYPATHKDWVGVEVKRDGSVEMSW